MTALIILLSALVFISLLYIIFMYPSRRRYNEMKSRFSGYIAHRGLFDKRRGIPENSLPAFRRARKSNFGIELDVRLTRDGIPVVFHDSSLHRMTGEKIDMRDISYSELRMLSLGDTSQHIPKFSEALSIVGGGVPIICEIKIDGDLRKVCSAVASLLDDYNGDFCIESFDPRVLWWFRRNRPAVLRGQLSMNYTNNSHIHSRLLRFILSRCLTNFITRPDFIAYDIKHTDSPRLKLMRALGAYMAGWTVRDSATDRAVRNKYETVIFDSFIPDNLIKRQ